MTNDLSVTCHALPPSLGGPGPNYLKPHVPVPGKEGDHPILSCIFCGRTLSINRIP